MRDEAAVVSLAGQVQAQAEIYRQRMARLQVEERRTTELEARAAGLRRQDGERMARGKLDGQAVAPDAGVEEAAREARAARELIPGMRAFTDSEARRAIRDLVAEFVALAVEMEGRCTERGTEIVARLLVDLGALAVLYGHGEIIEGFGGRGMLAGLGRFPDSAGASVFAILYQLTKAADHRGGDVGQQFEHLAAQLDRLAGCEWALTGKGAPKV